LDQITEHTEVEGIHSNAFGGEVPAPSEGAATSGAAVHSSEADVRGDTKDTEGDLSAPSEVLSVDAADEGGDGGARSSEPERPAAMDVPSAPSKKARKPLKSPLKVTNPAICSPSKSTEVILGKSLHDFVVDKKGGNSQDVQKLVIFNVHGTLLDCSLLDFTNPNTRIRSSTKTDLRRLVFRPWLKPFLGRCFEHFKVAFWGNNNAPYMQDVVPSMLAGLRVGPDPIPLFCWSDQPSGVLDIELLNPKTREKNLCAVYAEFPNFTPQNTLIVDSKSCRVSCNPDANVLITTPFYVKWLRTLSDDKEYLKCYLWPVLEAFWKCPDVSTFRNQYPQVVNDSMAQMLQNRRSGRPYEFLDIVEGEGTCRPHGFASRVSPHLHWNRIILTVD
jgi:hypothetical protein